MNSLTKPPNFLLAQKNDFYHSRNSQALTLRLFITVYNFTFQEQHARRAMKLLTFRSVPIVDKVARINFSRAASWPHSIEWHALKFQSWHIGRRPSGTHKKSAQWESAKWTVLKEPRFFLFFVIMIAHSQLTDSLSTDL